MKEGVTAAKVHELPPKSDSSLRESKNIILCMRSEGDLTTNLKV